MNVTAMLGGAGRAMDIATSWLSSTNSIGGNDVNRPRRLAEGYGVLRLMIDGVALIGKLKRVAGVRVDRRRARR